MDANKTQSQTITLTSDNNLQEIEIENKPNTQQKTILKELKLKMPKKVTFTEDTIDNEHMNKKKSKSNNIKYNFSLLYI
jgi:hypothetical protein